MERPLLRAHARGLRHVDCTRPRHRSTCRPELAVVGGRTDVERGRSDSCAPAAPPRAAATSSCSKATTPIIIPLATLAPERRDGSRAGRAGRPASQPRRRSRRCPMSAPWRPSPSLLANRRGRAGRASIAATRARAARYAVCRQCRPGRARPGRWPSQYQRRRGRAPTRRQRATLTSTRDPLPWLSRPLPDATPASPTTYRGRMREIDDIMSRRWRGLANSRPAHNWG